MHANMLYEKEEELKNLINRVRKYYLLSQVIIISYNIGGGTFQESCASVIKKFVDVEMLHWKCCNPLSLMGADAIGQ